MTTANTILTHMNELLGLPITARHPNIFDPLSRQYHRDVKSATQDAKKYRDEKLARFASQMAVLKQRSAHVRTGFHTDIVAAHQEAEKKMRASRTGSSGKLNRAEFLNKHRAEPVKKHVTEAPPEADAPTPTTHAHASFYSANFDPWSTNTPTSAAHISNAASAVDNDPFAHYFSGLGPSAQAVKKKKTPSEMKQAMAKKAAGVDLARNSLLSGRSLQDLGYY